MRYSFIAKDKDSNVIKGVEEVANQEELVGLLRTRGLFVVKIETAEVRAGGGPPTKERLGYSTRVQRFTHPGIRLIDLALFAKQVATLLNSGVPLLKSLEIISYQSESRQFAVLLRKISKDIEGGLSLSESVIKYPQIFSPLWKGLIQTGEASGNLGDVMDKLATYLEDHIAFLRKVTTAMLYPVILFVVALGVVGFFIGVILPRFKSIFEQFNMELPALTKGLFALGMAIKSYFVVVLIVGAFAGYFVYRYVKTKEGQVVLDRLKLSIPLFRDFFSVAYLERFSSVMSILMHSGVPIIYSLEVASSSVGNVNVSAMIDAAKDNVRGGKLLSEEMNHFAFFPPLLIEMIHIGEEAGNLPEMCTKMAKHYQAELATKTERFTAMFEPLMIVFMGGVVATVVLSIFMPLFKISTLGGSGGM